MKGDEDEHNLHGRHETKTAGCSNYAVFHKSTGKRYFTTSQLYEQGWTAKEIKRLTPDFRRAYCENHYLVEQVESQRKPGAAPESGFPICRTVTTQADFDSMLDELYPDTAPHGQLQVSNEQAENVASQSSANQIPNSARDRPRSNYEKTQGED